MAEKDKMHTGELYLPDDKEIVEYQTKCLDRLYEFNHTHPNRLDVFDLILMKRELFK